MKKKDSDDDEGGGAGGEDLAINPIPTSVVDELVKMLQELENSPSSDADVKQSHFQN